MKEGMIKQTSMLLFIVGIITLVFILISCYLQEQITSTQVFTVCFLFVGVVFSLLGIKYTGFLIKLFHVLTCYSCLVFSLLNDPLSIAAIVFLIITYFLCKEYEFIQKYKKVMIVLIIGYVYITCFSVLFFKKTWSSFLSFNFLSVFLISFLENMQKRNEDNIITILEKSETVLDKMVVHSKEILHKLEKYEHIIIEESNKNANRR
ncbi:MAG: hypothetical protein WC516_06605 [Patescibacteria group bacterium]